MKGYKIFDRDWKCRDFQYSCPGEFEMPLEDGEQIQLCMKGFHFCRELADCFYFKGFDIDNIRIAEVESYGIIDGVDDEEFHVEKFVTDKIRILREIKIEELFNKRISSEGMSLEIDDNKKVIIYKYPDTSFYEDKKICFLLNKTFKVGTTEYFIKNDIVYKKLSKDYFLISRCLNPFINEPILHEGIKEIGQSAFCNFSFLESIKIPNSVEKISWSAFDCCNVLKSIVIPDNVSRIEGQAFAYCRNLQNIILPKKIKNIPRSTFEGCSSLKEIELPEEIEEIDESAFAYCYFLKNISIPKNCFEIREWAFSDCIRLEKVFLPEGIEIDQYAFRNCISVKEVFYEGSKSDKTGKRLEEKFRDSMKEIQFHYLGDEKN